MEKTNKKDIEKLIKAPFFEERTDESLCSMFQLKSAPISSQIEVLKLSGESSGNLFFMECTSATCENVNYELSSIKWTED